MQLLDNRTIRNNLYLGVTIIFIVETFNFGTAIEKLRADDMLARLGWNGDHQITLQVPTELSKMTLPYIYITTQEGDEVPWVASQTDILATDWHEVK